MTTAGQIGIDLILNSTSFKKSLNNIQTQANNAGSKIAKSLSGVQSQANIVGSKILNSFSKIAKVVGTAFSVAMITRFGKSCIDLGSDLTEVQNVVDVTFKNMSSSVDKWAKQSQSQFGLSETMAKKYVGTFGPKLTLSDSQMQYELAFGIDFKDKQYSYDEILDLPQQIALERGKKFIVCIDEFQNVSNYEDALGFQRKLRAHWQRHNQVGYCMFGSKRHMLLDIFSNYEMPFYKFGDILFLDKIGEQEWVSFITDRFTQTGKRISTTQASRIAQYVACHPYYVQQLAQLVWLRTETVCKDTLIDASFEALVGQLSLLFSNIIDTLTAKQISFLQAIAQGERNFSSREVLSKYQLGTSANIKNLRKAMQDKDLIDVMPNSIQLQDPLFAYWLTHEYS